MYTRNLASLIKIWLDSNEIIIIYGARQVGKTTLLSMFFEKYNNSILFNCEQINIKQILESKDLEQIKLLFGNNKFIGLDEAQSIRNIGSVLKLIYDELNNKYKLIVTGSSSFDLSNKIIEPLTGRNVKFKLYPLSINEINNKHGWLWVKNNLNNLLIYGSFPGIIDLSIEKKEVKLQELASDYLFRDVLMHENIRNSDTLLKLLTSLAYQIGSQVSMNELAQQTKLAPKTVEKYLDLLEKSFVIFKLKSFSSNLRNEIKKSNKYYFYDLGIRNALINNFSSSQSRPDLGGLWENFCIAEMMKLRLDKKSPNYYFWRTYDGAEIDLIQVKNDEINAFEFKWNQKKKIKLPLSFAEKYEVKKLHIISPDNMHEFFINK